MNESAHRTHGPRTEWIEWVGLRLLVIENECVRLTVWPEHGADLIELRHKASDLDVLWKNPLLWPPRLRALDQPHGTRSEFYDVFHGGWFVSLPNGFFPTNYYGASLGCHGELQSVPWEAEILEQSAAEVRVKLVGRSVRTPWELTREIELRANDPVVRWHERLANRSATRLPVAWLHHPGFGGPLIEGAELVTNARTVLTPPADRPELAQLRPSYRGAWPRVPEQQGNDLRDCSRVPGAGADVEHVVHLTDFPFGWARFGTKPGRSALACAGTKPFFHTPGRGRPAAATKRIRPGARVTRSRSSRARHPCCRSTDWWKRTKCSGLTATRRWKPK